MWYMVITLCDYTIIDVHSLVYCILWLNGTKDWLPKFLNIVLLSLPNHAQEDCLGLYKDLWRWQTRQEEPNNKSRRWLHLNFHEITVKENIVSINLVEGPMTNNNYTKIMFETIFAMSEKVLHLKKTKTYL